VNTTKQLIKEKLEVVLGASGNACEAASAAYDAARPSALDAYDAASDAYQAACAAYNALGAELEAARDACGSAYKTFASASDALEAACDADSCELSADGKWLRLTVGGKLAVTFHVNYVKKILKEGAPNE